MTYQGLDSDWDGKSDSAEDSDALGGKDANKYALLGEIGVADLSFDPATQSELNTHDHTGDTINPSSVSVTNPPADSNDATRLQELDERALNQRTIFVRAGGSEEYHKLGTIANANATADSGGVSAELQFGDNALDPAGIELLATTRNGTLRAEHTESGAGANDRAQFVITHESNTNIFHLYMRTTAGGYPAAKITHDDEFWGGFDVQKNLAPADLVGSIAYDTGDQAPSMAVGVGDLTADTSYVRLSNNVWAIEPTVSDWGAAVNDTISQMAAGDVLMIPPAEYTTDTTVTPSKSVTIRGPGAGNSWQSPSTGEIMPSIRKTSDIPIIEPTGNYAIRVANLQLKGLGITSGTHDGTTDGIIFHGTSYAENVLASGVGGDAFYFHQANDTQNLNESAIWMCGARDCGGNGVTLENTSGTGTDLNAIRIYLRFSFNNYGWGVEQIYGHGNEIVIQAIEGGNHTGGIRFAQGGSLGKIIRAEGNINKGIQFDAEACVGETVFCDLPYDSVFIFNNDNNKGMSHRPVDPNIDQPYAASKFAGGIELTAPNGERFNGSETGTARGNSHGFGIAPVDLTTVAGDFDGQMRPDDGTNTAGRGVVCSWDDTGGVWRKPDGTGI